MFLYLFMIISDTRLCKHLKANHSVSRIILSYLTENNKTQVHPQIQSFGCSIRQWPGRLPTWRNIFVRFRGYCCLYAISTEPGTEKPYPTSGRCHRTSMQQHPNDMALFNSHYPGFPCGVHVHGSKNKGLYFAKPELAHLSP